MEMTQPRQGSVSVAITASSTANARPLPSLTSADRLFYLDTLRVVLTILVIMHHIGQAYGPTGGYWPIQESTRAAILGPFFAVNRSFFMSLFFLISGYFMVGSYQRNGFAGFLRGRMVRLGIPVLVAGTLALLLNMFVFGHRPGRWDQYFDASHLWYLEHVLLFSVLYALWQRVRKGRGTQHAIVNARRPTPGVPMTVAALLLVAVACGVVRLWSPIDRWMNLLGFFRVAFADVPRDLAFFIFGAVAFRRGWLEAFPVRRGMIWLAIGVAASIAWYMWELIPHGAVNPLAFGISRLVWEELVCFGMCIGLLVLFRQVANIQRPFGRLLAANQYSAYFWHPLLIVPMQMALHSLPLEPFVKFIAVVAVGVPFIFLWSWLLRNVRAVRAVL